jgi:hydroxylamine dehydrogenase
MQNQRVLISALVVTVVFLGIVLVVLAIISRPAEESGSSEVVNVLENSDNECVDCHENNSPGIVAQYGHSTMAAADVTCESCHEVKEDDPGAIEHEDTWVVNSPSPGICRECHAAEVAQFEQSRHGLPAYVAVAGAEVLSEEHLAQYLKITEGQPNPDRARNAIAAIEGDVLTRFTCYGCHNIGRPHEDGSAGECQQCHLRHEFSIEQARKPETCNACHIGPDHPQFEIYMESPHGIAYSTGSDDWNWDAEAGTMDVLDFPAPTCATCHFSGFGGTGTTHDVGDRLTWFLFAPVSERRPSWTDNQVRMQSVCQECHNNNFIDDFYTAADAATERVNEWVREENEILAELKTAEALTAEAFDQSIDFVIFDLWHHWGRTTKFGVWMQGPDYAQWHGAYELLRDMAELKEFRDEALDLHEDSDTDEPEDSSEGSGD